MNLIQKIFYRSFSKANFEQMKQALIIFTISLMLCSCAPQREFVAFGDAGTFRPGPQHSGSQFSGPEGEYDSYELVDNGGVPNQGIAPMYSGSLQRGYGHRNSTPSISPDTPMYYNARQPGYGGYNNGGYPRAVDTYDQHGNRQTMIIPNPW